MGVIIIIPNKNLKTYLQNIHTRVHQAKWESSEPVKAERLLNKFVDAKLTINPIIKFKYTDKYSIKTYIQALTASLPTKPVIRQTGWYNNKKDSLYTKTHYSNDWCDYCLDNNIIKKETHEHIFSETLTI